MRLVSPAYKRRLSLVRPVLSDDATRLGRGNKKDPLVKGVGLAGCPVEFERA